MRHTRGGGRWARSNFDISTKGSNIHVGYSYTQVCTSLFEMDRAKGVACALFLDFLYSCSYVCIFTIHRWRKVTLTTKILLPNSKLITFMVGRSFCMDQDHPYHHIKHHHISPLTHCLLSSSQENKHRSQRVIYIGGGLTSTPFLKKSFLVWLI